MIAFDLVDGNGNEFSSYCTCHHQSIDIQLDVDKNGSNEDFPLSLDESILRGNIHGHSGSIQVLQTGCPCAQKPQVLACQPSSPMNRWFG